MLRFLDGMFERNYSLVRYQPFLLKEYYRTVESFSINVKIDCANIVPVLMNLSILIVKIKLIKPCDYGVMYDHVEDLLDLGHFNSPKSFVVSELVSKQPLEYYNRFL